MDFHIGKRKKAKSHILLMILAFFILCFVAIRFLIPTMMVTLANRQLAKESPYFAFHIDDIDLKIFRGQYVVEGITGKIKATGENFLKVESVTANVPWKEIFNGLIVTDVLVNRFHVAASQNLLDQAKLEMARLKKEYPPKEKKEEKESKFRLRSFTVNDSDVLIHDFMSFKGKEQQKVTNIKVKAMNLTPTAAQPETTFKVGANVFGPSPLIVDGKALLKKTPPEWDANIQLKEFDLSTINPFLREKLQAYIQKGKLDNYVEVKSTAGVIEGYEKPFVSKLKMETPKGGFKFKGAAAKTGGNLVKLLLTDSEAKTLATKVPFTYKDKLEYEIIPALTKAIEHKAKQNIQPGIENQFSLDGSKTMQAQEAQ